MNWYRRLFAWRWLPVLGLSLASVTFVGFALLFADGATSGSKNEHGSQKSAPSALRFDDFVSAPLVRDAPAPLTSSDVRRDDTVAAPEVRSFFPPAAMELPPPLEEDEPVPEPPPSAPPDR